MHTRRCARSIAEIRRKRILIWCVIKIITHLLLIGASVSEPPLKGNVAVYKLDLFIINHLFCVTLLLVIMFVLVKIIYLVISLMIISCQTLLGRLDVCMVLSHPLRMLFVIFPVHKIFVAVLVFFAVLAPKLVCVIFNNNNKVLNIEKRHNYAS